ncbi:MAG: YceI family protein [Bacteroidia bacterium]|nr:YceI family protein [Bacteroidia bacterium]
MKNIGFILLLIGQSLFSYAQKFVTESSSVSFFSDGAIEDISAQNSKAVSIFNSTTGDIVYSIPIKDFEFEKSLMKEHFNEKYLETEKFPKATFQGKISGFTIASAGEQIAKAAGKLTIHGVTKEIEVPGTVEIAKGKLVMKSKFMVKLEDYSIAIPQLLWQNLAEEVEVKIEFTYKAQ